MGLRGSSLCARSKIFCASSMSPPRKMINALIRSALAFRGFRATAASISGAASATFPAWKSSVALRRSGSSAPLRVLVPPVEFGGFRFMSVACYSNHVGSCRNLLRPRRPLLKVKQDRGRRRPLGRPRPRWARLLKAIRFGHSQRPSASNCVINSSVVVITRLAAE